MTRSSFFVMPTRLFQRMILVYVRDPNRSRPYRRRTSGFCASKFFEHQNQSVSQRQM